MKVVQRTEALPAESFSARCSSSTSFGSMANHPSSLGLATGAVMAVTLPLVVGGVEGSAVPASPFDATSGLLRTGVQHALRIPRRRCRLRVKSRRRALLGLVRFTPE